MKIASRRAPQPPRVWREARFRGAIRVVGRAAPAPGRRGAGGLSQGFLLVPRRHWPDRGVEYGLAKQALCASSPREMAADRLDAAHGERDEALVQGRRLRRHFGDHDSVLGINEDVLAEHPHPEGQRRPAAPHVPLAAVVGFHARKSEYTKAAEDWLFGT